MHSNKIKISGWGNFPKISSLVFIPSSIKEIKETIQLQPQLLARGAGKSYGDSSLFHTVIDMRKINNILSKGECWIEVEAGATIGEVLKHTVPNGEMLPVTPGTKNVTIGGAIASNIHGKNQQHKGCFENQVLSVKVMDKDGDIYECSPFIQSDNFYGLFGAMGLNGIIISAKLKLVPIETCFLKETQFFVDSVEQLVQTFQQNKSQPFTVAWLNLLSNKFSGIVKTAKWVSKNEISNVKNLLFIKDDARLNIPFIFPFAPPPILFKLYNQLIYSKAKKKATEILHYNDYFFMLDSIKNWNRIFGPKGFIEYQVVLPLNIAELGMQEIVDLVRSSKATCPMATVKIFDKVNELTIYSFPMEGFCITIDFLNNRYTKDIIAKLDIIVSKYNGRIYKTKDSLSSLPTALPTTKFQSNQNIRYANNRTQ